MFGDFFKSETVLIANTAGLQSLVRMPTAGGSQRFNNEHSRALPTDRVFGSYHHFENAVQANAAAPGFPSTSANIDRFTLGFEKTFLEGNTSVELRLPLSTPVSFSSPDSNFQSSTVGNLVVNLKGLLYSDESQAVALGLAINTPTADDLTVALPSSVTTSSFTIDNNAVHLIPYVAYQAAPTDNFFFNGFLQFDTPTNGNNLRVVPAPGAGAPENRTLNDQTLLYLNTSFGYWLYHDADADFFNGLAGLLEVHYATALNDPDIVSARDKALTFGTNTGRVDSVNMAFGLHAQLARSTIIRTAYVTPLRDGNHRLFDGEITVAVIFRR